MADITITINTDNAAFGPRFDFEVSRILVELSKKVKGINMHVPQYFPLIDMNGNKVGEFNTEETAMNLLILKAIVYDAKSDTFVSPSRKEFVWKQDGIVTSVCQRHILSPFGVCTPDVRAEGCSCGIYGSSHPVAVQEYVDYPNSIIVLMNCYGWAEIWTGPKDLYHTFITTVYSARVVGVLNAPQQFERGISHISVNEETSRQNAIAVAAEYFQVNTYPWDIMQEMISITWKHWAKFDPYIQNDYLRMETERDREISQQVRVATS